MSRSPAEIIAAWLVSQGLGVTPPSTSNWVCYVASLPDEGNNALCVFDTAGILEGRIQRTGETIQKYGIQVSVRSQDYPTGWGKAAAICEAFDGLLNATLTVGSTQYKIHAVTRKTAIIPLGPEEDNKRERFTINFLATITELP